MDHHGEHQAASPKPRRRRITKRELMKRDLRLIEKLAAGVTIEEIAASERISVKWAKERKAAVLASRVPDTPHEFIQLQIRRLSEAMLVSYSAMSNGDLSAVDKVIKVARELERYHGFALRPETPSSAPSLPAAPPPPLALPEPTQTELALPWDENEPSEDPAPRDGVLAGEWKLGA